MIPIVKTHTSLKKLLNSDIKYTDLKIRDFLDELFVDLYNYVNNNKLLSLTTDRNTFHKYFIKFVYNEYFLHKNMRYIVNTKNIENLNEYYEILYESFEYFSLKYSEDISEIFSNFKNKSEVYNVSLFHSKKDTYYPLIEFLFYNCDLVEYEEDEEEIEIVDDLFYI